MENLTRSRVPSKRWSRLLLAFTALFSAINLSGQSAGAPAMSAVNQPAPSMKTFVLIFRQARSRPRTDAENQRLAEEMGPWARRQNGVGHKLDPRILAPESVRCGQEIPADSLADEWSVGALMFLEARDLNEAVQVAESHPVLRYGASIEVRPWAPPVPVAPAAKTPAVP